MQRLDRKQYIRRLKKKLLKIPVDPLEEEERLIWEKIVQERLQNEKEEDEKYQLSMLVKEESDSDEEKEEDGDAQECAQQVLQGSAAQAH